MHLDNCDYFLSQLRTVVMTALILSFFVTGKLHRYRYSCSGNVDDNGYGKTRSIKLIRKKNEKLFKVSRMHHL